MHIAIMKRHKHWERERETDHIDTCGCDNRKENLRLATSSMNDANKRLQSNNTSGVTGVTWNKNCSKWKVQIVIDKKYRYLGSYDDFNEAVKRRQQAEYKYFGKFRYDPTNICPLGYTGKCPDCAARLKELAE